MPLFGAPDVGFVLLGGRSIIGDLTEIQDSHSIVLEETTSLGVADDTWASVKARKYDGKLLAIYSDAGVLTAFESGSTQALMYALEGNTIGKEFSGVDAVRTAILRQSVRDALHRLEASFKAATRMDKGVVLASHVARATGATTASVNNGAASTAGGAGYLGVSALALGGYTSVTIIIQDSADNVAFATKATFANVTAAPASERLAIAGTIRQYTRILVTFNGAGASESITAAVGLARY